MTAQETQWPEGVALGAPGVSAAELDGGRRLRAIEQLGVLEQVGDPALAGVARIAAHLAGARAAAVYSVDGLHLRAVAGTGGGLASGRAVREECGRALQLGTPQFTPDATCDPRFAESALITGDTPVRFFAAFPLHSSRKQLIGVLSVVDVVARRISPVVVQRLIDLAAQAQTQLELMSVAVDLGEAAMRDPLTGVVNRAVFEDRLGHALARSRRHRRTVFVAMLDIDDFKLVNDTFGHARGDEVLCLAARRLRELAREEDTIGRLGGDEFGLVAEVSLAGTRRLQQRLEGAFSGVLEPRSGAVVTVGTAVAQAGDDARAALARADRAMYAAKHHPSRRLRVERVSGRAPR